MKRILATFLMCAAMAWGTVTTTDNTANFSCNGSTTAFPFTFPIAGTDTSQLQVTLRTVATGAETILTETTHYTVSATNNDYSSGGTVTTVATYSSDYALSIVRVTPVTQTADLSSRSSVSYASLEAYFDKAIMVVQDLTQKLTLTLKAPASDSGTSYEIPEAAIRAGKYLAFDSSGDPIASSGTSSNPAISTYGETLVASADEEAARDNLELGTADAVEFAGITGTTGTFSGTVSATTGTFSGAITANGGVALGAGDHLTGSATSNIVINTNKFIVYGATGNTQVTGNFTAVGVSTLGETVIGSTLSVAGALNPTGGILGTFSHNDSDAQTLAKAHAYLTTQDGIVTAYMTNLSGALEYTYGYIGSTDDPAGAGTLVAPSRCLEAGEINFISFPVPKGKYWEITTDSAGTVTINWHPFGTLSLCVDQD